MFFNVGEACMSLLILICERQAHAGFIILFFVITNDMKQWILPAHHN